MLKAEITKYSHFFKVSKIHPSIIPVLNMALRQLLEVKIIKKRGKVFKENGRVYAARGMNKSEYRFHLNYLHDFLTLLKNYGVQENEIQITTLPIYQPATVTVKMPPSFQLRDYQEICVDYIMNDGVSKLITLQTGEGKTQTSLKAMELIGHRMMVLVLGRYREKWIEDIKNAYGNACHLCVVQGFSHLIQLIQDAKEGKPLANIFLLTITVLQRYIREWELHQGNQIEGMIPPEELYETLGIGVRLIDEVHQHFHANFKIELYTHCPKCIYLTATLDARDKFMNFIYTLIWPQRMRMQLFKPKKYDHTYAVFYQHHDPERIRLMTPSGYSHILYEKWLHRNVYAKCEWLDMIGDQVETHFLPLYKPGRRMAIYCSLVDTCEMLAKYLNIRFKDLNLKISSFTAQDEKEVIETNDITCTTLGKAGTALDIPGMIVVLLTVALAEPKMNKQVKGRNRDNSKKPGFEDVIPRFVYLVGDDIKKHRDYHKAKKSLLHPYTLAQYEIRTNYVLGQPFSDYLSGLREARWEAWGEKPRRY